MEIKGSGTQPLAKRPAECQAVRTPGSVVLLVTVSGAVEALHAMTSSGGIRQAASSHSIAITRSGTQPSSKGSAQYFTGTARVDPRFDANEPSRASGASVTFCRTRGD